MNINLRYIIKSRIEILILRIIDVKINQKNKENYNYIIVAINK